MREIGKTIALMKLAIAEEPENVGKFVERSTQEILGAPGKTPEEIAVKPSKTIKETLRDQAIRELTTFPTSE